jgi:orotate phosphoribosyltransferase
MPKQYLIDIINSPLVSKSGKFKLKGGSETTFYRDIKKAYGIPGFPSNVAIELNKIINPGATCIATMGLGGYKIGAIYQEMYKLPEAQIRDQEKTHGTGDRIEGYIPKENDKIIIVDDVYTSETSLKETAKVIRDETGAKIIQACVILERNKPNLPFPVKSILTLDDLK